MLKAFITKTVSGFVFAAALFLCVSESQAATQCFIHLTAPCFGSGPNPYFAPHRAFLDVDGIANLDAGRCAERAAEYAGWCAAPGLPAPTSYAMFFVDNRPVQNTIFTNGYSYIYSGLWKYTGFSK